MNGPTDETLPLTGMPALLETDPAFKDAARLKVPTSAQRRVAVARPEAMLFMAMLGAATLASAPVGDCPALLTVMRAGLFTSLPKAVMTWSLLFNAVTVSAAGEVMAVVPAT